MDRRDFLTAAAVGATGLISATSPAKDPLPMIEAIDTHQHLWDLSKFKLGWLKKGTELDASFTPKEYAAATKDLKVVKAVYMEVDVIPEQQQAEVDYLTELCKGKTTPTVAAVVSGRPGKMGFEAYVAQFKANKFIKGLRQVLHVDSTPAGYCLEKAFVADVQFLGELGLSFDLCMRPTDLTDGAKLAEKCPDTRFILDHCGNPQFGFTAKQKDQWKLDLATVAKQKNVMCKLSGFVANGWPKGKWKADDVAWVINATIDTFGVDRCMFGGDWPVCTLAGTYGDWIGALRQVIASRPEVDQKKLLHDNAVKFYGI
jgi:predicted TIM-barrel fold metal-dependent hydrolase